MSGNNSLLETLIEPTAPESISWLPETIGWKVLLLLSLAGLAYFTVRKVQKWRANRYRRSALKFLSRVENKPTLQAIKEINQILKATAVTAYGHEQVASLYGQQWVEFLRGDSSLFYELDTNRKWQVALYTPAVAGYLTQSEVQYLIAQSRFWVTQHTQSKRKEVKHA